MKTDLELKAKSIAYRQTVLRIIKQARAGHTGGDFSAIDILNDEVAALRRQSADLVGLLEMAIEIGFADRGEHHHARPACHLRVVDAAVVRADDKMPFKAEGVLQPRDGGRAIAVPGELVLRMIHDHIASASTTLPFITHSWLLVLSSSFL